MRWGGVGVASGTLRTTHSYSFKSGTTHTQARARVRYIANNAFVQFQIWDFPGDFDFSAGDPLVYGGQLISPQVCVWAGPGLRAARRVVGARKLRQALVEVRHLRETKVFRL